MTQTVGVLQEHEETLSQRAARRLRGCLAENRISQTDLARVLHMPQQKVSRKVNGQTPLTLDELQMVAGSLGVALEALLGVGDYAERPIGLCAIRDSNPEPADSAPLRHLHVVARVRGDFPTVPPVKPGRHLGLVRPLGGAA